MKNALLLFAAILVIAFVLLTGCDDEADKSYLNSPFVPDPNDASPPVVNIIIPADSSLVPKDDSIRILVLASDDTGIRRINLTINDILVFEDKELPYEYYWDTSSLSSATPHEICAIAYDNGGRSTVTCNNVKIQ